MRISVDEVMTLEPMSVGPTTLVKAARDLMKQASFRHLPVIDSDRHVVGIISDRDVLRAFELSRDLDVPVRMVMTQDVMTVFPHTNACEATALMLDHKIGALPVIDEKQNLVGVVTETDFVRIAHQILGGGNLSDPK